MNDTTTPLPATAWPTIDEASDRLFSWFDTNEDGTITVDEVVGVIDPADLHGDALNVVVARVIGLVDTNDDDAMSEAEVNAALTELDTNGDGSLTPRDLGSQLATDGRMPMLAVLLQGGPLPGVPQPHPPVEPDPPQPPRAPGVDDVVAALLVRFDGDDDGSITLAELLAVLDPRDLRPRIDDAMAALVQAVDSSDDGAMDEAELTAAVATLDTDGNGTLDRHDHVPGPPDGDAIDLVGVLLPRLREFDVATLADFG